MNNGVNKDSVFNPYKLENNNDNSNNEEIKNELGDNNTLNNTTSIDNNVNEFNSVTKENNQNTIINQSNMIINNVETTIIETDNIGLNNFNTNTNSNTNLSSNQNSQQSNTINNNLPKLPESKVFIPTNMRKRMEQGVVYSNIANLENNNATKGINDNLIMENGSFVNNEHVSKKEKRSKLIALIGLIIVVIFVIGLIIKNIFFGASKELDLIFDPKQPIPVQDGEFYGYVTHSGEEMISVKYTYAGKFYGKYACVKEDKDKKPYSIIDTDGKVHASSENNFSYVSECNTWYTKDGIYNSKIKKVSKGEIEIRGYLGNCLFSYTDGSSLGIISSKGEVKYKNSIKDYSISISINEFDDEDVYASLEMASGSIIVDVSSGKEIRKFDRIYEPAENGIFYSDSDSSYGSKSYVYFRDGKLAYQVDNVKDLSVYDYKKGLLEIYYGYDVFPSYRYYNVKKNKIDESLDSQISKLDDTLKIYKDIYGYVPIEHGSNNEGILKRKRLVVGLEHSKVVFPEPDLYTYIKDEKSKHLVLLYKDNDIFLFNLKWRTKIETFKDAAIAVFDDTSTFMAVKYNNGNSRVYNLLTNKYLDLDVNNITTLGSNYFIEKQGNKIIYYNTKMKKVFEGTT